MSTVWLDMSEDEQLLYNLHHCAESHFSHNSTLKLEACSHLYCEEVVIGTDHRFSNVLSEMVMMELFAQADNPI